MSVDKSLTCFALNFLSYKMGPIINNPQSIGKKRVIMGAVTCLLDLIYRMKNSFLQQ